MYRFLHRQKFERHFNVLWDVLRLVFVKSCVDHRNCLSKVENKVNYAHRHFWQDSSRMTSEPNLNG